MFVDPLHHDLVSTIAEGSIRRQFAVAELVVARLRHVEVNRSVSSQDPLALSIAPGRNLGVTAWAPVVHLTTMQVDVSGVNTSVCRQRGRSILSFLVGSWLSELHDILLREVCDVVHSDLRSGCRRLFNVNLKMWIPSGFRAWASEHLFRELSSRSQLG